MRKIFYFIIFTVLMLSAGCTHDNPALREAERLMDEDYTEALRILDSIPEETLTNKRDRALYGFLLTQAQEKNHLDPANDSLITAAADYFADNNDLRHLTTATYYQGVIRQRNGCQSEALLSFLKASDLARKERMDFWAGMASRGMADIYGESFNRADAVQAARDEVRYLTKSGRQPYIDYALNDLAAALCNLRATDESMKITAQVRDSAMAHENPHLLHLAHEVEVTNYLIQDRYGDALRILESMTADGFADTQDSLNYSLALVQTGNRAESKRILSLIPEDGNEGRKSQIRSLLSMGKGDFQTAGREMLRIDSVADHLFTEGMNRQFNTIIRDYHQLQDQTADLKQHNARLILWLLILCLLAAGVIIALLIRNALKRKSEHEAALIALSDDLDKIGLENETLKRKKLDLLISHSNLLSKVRTPDREKGKEESVDKTEALARSMIEALTENTDSLLHLEEEINLTYDNLITRLRSDVPNLKEIDYRLFMLLVIGLPLPAVGLVLGQPIEKIYSRKKRLKWKIMALDSERRTPYEEYL